MMTPLEILMVIRALVIMTITLKHAHIIILAHLFPLAFVALVAEESLPIGLPSL